MAKVEMDLKELEAIKDEINIAKKETEQVRKELNEKISKLQDEKTALISNQKRVMFTKKVYDVKQYLPCTHTNIVNMLDSVFSQAFKDNPFYNYPNFYDKENLIKKSMVNFFETQCIYEKQNDTITLRGDKEENFEFINLDDAVQIALEQKGSIYGERLSILEKENVNLKSKLAKFDANKKLEIENIIEEKNHECQLLKEEASEKIKNLTENADKKYKQLEEDTDKKYKKLEEEFAKYRDDEEKMNMNDKLEKYQKENVDLKKKIEDLEKKLNSKSLFKKIFG